LTEFLRQRVM